MSKSKNKYFILYCEAFIVKLYEIFWEMCRRTVDETVPAKFEYGSRHKSVNREYSVRGKICRWEWTSIPQISER